MPGDLRQGPDGYIYLVIDDRDGKPTPVLRMEPSRRSENDPLWRLPLWRPYHAMLDSKVADTNNVSSGGFAGSITAALFLLATALLAAPNEFTKDLLDTRYRPLIAEALSGQLGRQIRVAVTVEPLPEDDVPHDAVPGGPEAYAVQHPAAREAAVRILRAARRALSIDDGGAPDEPEVAAV